MRLWTYRRAGAVVIDGDRVLLATMQPPGQRRWWHVPGGGIEEGETPAEAATRELFEEAGLVASSARLILQAGIHGCEHHYFLMTCDDLTLGPVTGPELEYAADADFRLEWVPIADLHTMPVFPRCVAEHVARGIEQDEVHAAVPWIEDDRSSWDGIEGEGPPAHIRVTARAVVVDAGRLAVIRRSHGDREWFTLPGGGVELGESVAAAAVREVREEISLEVEPIGTQAVVVFEHDGRTTIQSYIRTRVVAGELGPGDGDEHTPDRQAERGTYEPRWVDVAALPASLRPAWLHERLPAWLAAPPPTRAERFVERHD